MPLIARMVDDALDDTREHLETLSEARVRPQVGVVRGTMQNRGK